MKFLPNHGERGFRWRWQGETSRIEGLSDGVFGFAITLLVISLEVPKTFDDLMILMRGLIPFAASFAILILIWYQQYRFFRRYALQDVPSVVLNAILLFVVIAYVYPLKFLFTLLFNRFTGHGMTTTAADGSVVPMIRGVQNQQLMIIYGAGYLAIFLVFMLLYLHAWRRREMLELSPREVFVTRAAIEENALQAGIALLSIVIATFGHLALSGLVYWLIGPVAGGHGWWRGSQKARLFPEESNGAALPAVT
jgi:uncharacterized membrane protein